MNYKKIISSRALRIKIMQTLVGAFFFDLGIVFKKQISEMKGYKFFGGY